MDFTNPAIPCISEGMIILVALPSAALAKASKLFNWITASFGAASFKKRIPSAVACCTVRIASA